LISTQPKDRNSGDVRFNVKIYLQIALGMMASIAALIAVAFLAIVQPGGSGVIASKTLPDGCEYKVIQTCNWSGEPYTVSFYMRSPGQKWGWCYIDHEAPRWWDASLSYDSDADVILVKEDEKIQARLERKQQLFWIGDHLSVSAPQESREPPSF
jgi:hypothetical protein